MGDKSAIEWTDATWNPIAGCSVISPGCKHCYAMTLARRLELMGQAKYAGLTTETKAGAVFNGVVRFDGKALEQPGRWKRPRRILVNSMSDLFHKNVPDAWIDQVVAEMATTRWHTYQVLTKRAGRMRAYLEGLRDGRTIDLGAGVMIHLPKPLPNVWWGVSVEDQARADERIPELMNTPAAIRFLSCEPLLEGIRIGRYLEDHDIDWVIAGGESGHRARWMQPAWARSLRDQCNALGVPFFFKQWGEWLIAERHAGRSSCSWQFGDGDRLDVVNEQTDIIVATAQEHRGEPQRIWGRYGATGDGQLAKRPGKSHSGRAIDGMEWSMFPTADRA
jgi:protein gp37